MLHRIPDSQSPVESEPLELAALDAAIAGAAAGSGELVVVEAPAGDSTSRLLAEAARRAGEAGVEVLAARGVEGERGAPFGVARRLFAPMLERLDGEERARMLTGAARFAAPLFGGDHDRSAPDAADLSVMHGLYWLTSNLADRAPLALLIDDAQWADVPSLRLCVYLARRVDELPVALVVAARPGEPGAPSALLDALAGRRRAL